METIDMSQVAGFKAVDAEGNELGVVSMNELTESISKQVLQTIAMRNQATTLEQPALMSAASTLATGNDAYENELQQVSDANWVRALLADGTPVLWNKSDLASVVGGLQGALNQKQNASNSSKVEYVKLASFNLQKASIQEGVSNAISLLVIGGNAYTSIRQLSFVSITSHRGIVYAKKNSILGSVEIGYSVNDNTLDVWVHTADYRHYVNTVLLGTSRATMEYSIQIEMPNNYKVIE